MFMCRIVRGNIDACLKYFLRLLLGGVGWGFGTMLAGQGDTKVTVNRVNPIEQKQIIKRQHIEENW